MNTLSKRLLGHGAMLMFAAIASGCVSTTETTRGGRDAPEMRDVRTARGGTPDAAPLPGEESDVRRRARLRVDLAASYYQSGNYNVAIEEINKAIAIDGSYAGAYGMLGLIYMDLNDRARAEQNFQQALKLAPDDSDLNNNYGWYLCQTQREKDSIQYFMTALKNPLYTTPARPWHNAGICSLRMGDESAAENYFQRSFQVDPANPVAMFNLAELYLKRGVIDRAKFYSERLVKGFQPSAETVWLALRVARRAGDRDAAASLGSQLRRQFPNSREAAMFARGEYDK
jgi:type IV pilus assembly protein PilF